MAFNETKLHDSWSVAFPHRFKPDSGIPVVNSTIMRKLLGIYQKFSSEKNFPYEFCADASQEVRRQSDLKTEQGFFLLDMPIRERRYLVSHNWNIDRENNIVDLTAAQFNRGLQEPFPAGVVIISPEASDYWRYLPEGHPIVRIFKGELLSQSQKWEQFIGKFSLICLDKIE